MDINFITNDIKNLKFNSDYQRITSVLSRMDRSGAITLGTGYCTSMADMVRSALKHQNINSKLVECQLTITYYDEEPYNVKFVGFSDIINPGEIDTHIVVVTDTTPPFLIDASIKHRLPKNATAVVEPILREPGNLYLLVDTKFELEKIAMTYQQKRTQSFAISHNDSIIERIETDKKIFKNLSFLKLLIVVALIIGVFNAIRGTYDFYQVYVNSDNYRGPSGIQNIAERLDNLENLIRVPVEERK